MKFTLNTTDLLNNLRLKNHRKEAARKRTGKKCRDGGNFFYDHKNNESRDEEE